MCDGRRHGNGVREPIFDFYSHLFFAQSQSAQHLLCDERARERGRENEFIALIKCVLALDG